MCADNSGAKMLKVIGMKKHLKKKKIHVGEIVCVTVKKARRKEKFKKDFFFALILSSKVVHKRKQGFYLKSDKNRALLLSQTQKILGTRIYGPVYTEIKKTAQKKNLYKKLISYI